MGSSVYAVRGRVVLPDRILTDGVVVVAGDAIAWVGESTDARVAGFGQEVLDAEAPSDDRLILPGLVDVHCHGGGAQSFPDSTSKDQALTAVMEHRQWGTTSLVASLVTASPMVLRERAEMLADLADAGQIAGIHFEGPFIAQGHCGAQDPRHIQSPNPALTRELLIASRGHAVSMTVAPEKPYTMGPGGVAETLVDGGAVASFGHTDTNAQRMRQALREIRETIARSPMPRCAHATVTHLFNGMAPMHHRDPGPVPEILADAAGGGVIVEIIADGVHVSPELVRNVYELVGREQIVFVTDAMAAAGVADGAYVLGGQEVEVSDGVARLGRTGAIAGGTAHLIDVVRTAHAAGIPLVDAVYMASVQGARILGNDQVGRIGEGYRADLVVVTPDLEPMRVIFRGDDVVGGEA
ncbi:amidohydrolase family protein [Nanchangia anserum]|uniref:Amidohydrolase family protein n=1 Tax=Nanchangia anserum TaxID=2692125 RepID=A0A8I0G8N9_9ACTO|nr:amidohydrolase family protein [Nanchangia anserum]MBD3689927.1 amidohydrolase family protein [Nanchangia anserum]QOX82258.1 amidohydrolase family protein [Nanchangia anserum]